MSSVFIELGLLVLAAFGLGMLVGWLAWGAKQQTDHRAGFRALSGRGTKASMSDKTAEPPGWQGRPIPPPNGRRRMEPPTRSLRSGFEQTVIIGSRD